MEKVIVIGGGISGFIAGINAKNENNEVIILEGKDKPLNKLLITGNGKCNYFNEDFSLNCYNSKDKDVLDKIITPENKNKSLEFFCSIGIVPKIKNGYYYPSSNQAVSVKNALLKEAEIKGVQLLTDNYVKSINTKNDKFIIETTNNTFISNKLIISTGSKSYPKTGSDGSGYFLSKNLGHTIKAVFPSLVGLKAKDKYFKDLSGVRSDATVTLIIDGKEVVSDVGEVQFTNYGLSGICIFNISSFVGEALSKNKNVIVSLNFMNSFGIDSCNKAINFLEDLNKKVNRRSIADIFDNILNYKLGNVILKKSNIDGSQSFDDLTSLQKNDLAKNLVSFTTVICDTNGFDNAQVCTGGVSLSEVNSYTFESLIVPGLYFTGEVLDVDGKCGGYNIAFACLSGLIAGRSASND